MEFNKQKDFNPWTYINADVHCPPMTGILTIKKYLIIIILMWYVGSPGS